MNGTKLFEEIHSFQSYKSSYLNLISVNAHFLRIYKSSKKEENLCIFCFPKTTLLREARLKLLKNLIDEQITIIYKIWPIIIIIDVGNQIRIVTSYSD